MPRRRLPPHFEPKSSQQLYTAQCHNQHRRPEEDPAVHTSALPHLGRFALPYDVPNTARDKSLVEQYVDGLHDTRIRMALQENWPSSLSAMVTRTLELQAARDVEQILVEPVLQVVAVQSQQLDTISALTDMAK